MKLEGIEIHLLSDGCVRADAGGPFGLVPRRLSQRWYRPDRDNTVPMVLLSLLVRTEGKTILVDTGLGGKLTPEEARLWRIERENGGLLEALRNVGVAPEDVDIVINTHLHADHCGGNTWYEEGVLTPTFPRARYCVQRIEWAEASHPDARTRGTYLPENFTPLVREGRMQLLHGDTPITDHVRCVVTPGHTRGHQSVILQAGGWRGLFVADMASFAIHMERAAWLTAYDVLPLENLRTKARWADWAVDSRAWLFFQHDPERPVGRRVRRDGRATVSSIQGAEELTAGLPIPRPTRG
jgi:glyoxylase-like metal-dependent hydrolase (beta-lactamase superfamily II)